MRCRAVRRAGSRMFRWIRVGRKEDDHRPGGAAREWVFAEIYQPLIADPDSDEWKAVVSTELKCPDYVVLDWSDEVSENMVWELHQTVNQLPTGRVVMLLTRNNKARVEQVLDRLLTVEERASLVVGVSPYDQLTNLLFLRGLERAMRRLTVSLRPWVRPQAVRRRSSLQLSAR